MKKTPQYFECLRLRADSLAYQYAARYYAERLKSLDKDTSEEIKGNLIYLSAYCSIKSEELQLQAIEKLETEPEWLNSMSRYTPCEWNREFYKGCNLEGMFRRWCKHDENGEINHELD